MRSAPFSAMHTLPLILFVVACKNTILYCKQRKNITVFAPFQLNNIATCNAVPQQQGNEAVMLLQWQFLTTVTFSLLLLKHCILFVFTLNNK